MDTYSIAAVNHKHPGGGKYEILFETVVERLQCTVTESFFYRIVTHTVSIDNRHTTVMLSNIKSRLYNYFIKFLGQDSSKHPKSELMNENFKSLIDSFISVLILSSMQTFWLEGSFNNVNIMVGSFAASIVLLHSAYKSPLSQPW